MKRPALSKGDLGEAARQTICAKLMMNGLKVFRPMTEDTPIDLLVLRSDGNVLKCQCKYAYPRKNDSHCLNLYSVRKNGPSSKAIRHRYRPDEVDFFLAYCLDNDGVYVIPYAATVGRDEITMWIRRQPVTTIAPFMTVSKYINAFDLLGAVSSEG